MNDAAPATADADRLARIAQLRQGRSRSPFLRASLLVGAVLIAVVWSLDSPYRSLLTAEQKRANLQRFIDDLKPQPVRESGDWGDAIPWAVSMLVPVEDPRQRGSLKTRGRGLEAAGRTFALATAAAALSGLLALILLPAAARNLATRRPLGIHSGSRAWSKLLWRPLSLLTRMFFVFTRSLPEFLLGFVLVAVFGPENWGWALVLALAIHNLGILGRLGAEVIENSPHAAARTVIAHGGGRLGTYFAALLPESFNRMVVYFFYRWETCVREATVLGMLSVMSLGFLIDDAISKQKSDRMVFYILLGAAIVVLGDLLSALVRRWLRYERY